MPRFQPPQGQSGFTALEIVVVLIIIGIVSVVVLGRSNIGKTDLLAQTEVIKSHIRYAQSRSMNSNRSWGIRIEASGRSYALFVDGNIANRRVLPGEDADAIDLALFSLTLAPGGTILSFDDRGRPLENDGTSLRTSDLFLTVSTDGGEATAIRVTCNTGFVQ